MIAKDICKKVLQVALSTGGDFAEIFAENTKSHSISMVASKVDTANDIITTGAAIRIYKGLRSVMASTVDISEQGLIRCAQRAADTLGEGSANIDIVLTERIFANKHQINVVPSSVENRKKVDILKSSYFAAKEYNPLISQVKGMLKDNDRNILIANTDGLYTTDRQIRTRMFISAVAEKDGETQTGAYGPGRQMGLEMFDRIAPESIGQEAARQAVTMVSAGYCPAGVMPVAIGNGFGGVIFHEACGHSLEASAVAYGQSQFCGKLGEKVANEKVTAIDDGTLPNEWGSINIDDEGTPSRKNILIENGILKNYMIDKFNARRMKMEPTGSARRESYQYVPTSRMTNTYIAPGNDSFDSIISSMEFGLYAMNMGGGSVNPTTGEFNFAVNEGYIVRNGKICEPVRGASLVGKGSDIIQKIDMVSDNLMHGQGMCGSSSGSVPVNVGQPTIRVSSITVGGR